MAASSGSDRGRGRTLVRALAGFFLLGLLFYWIPLERVLAALLAVSPVHLAGAFAVGTAEMLVSAWRLRKLVFHGKNPGAISPLRLVGIYYVGQFFNNFLPLTLGGDVVKVRALHNHGVSLRRSGAAVIMERFTGVLTVLILGMWAALPGTGWLEALSLGGVRWPYYALAVPGVAAVPLLFFYGAKTLMRWVRRWEEAPGMRFLRRGLASARAYRDEPRVFVPVFGLALVFFVLRALKLVLLSRGMGWSFSFWVLLAVVPVVTLVSLLPVSLGSLGVREGALTFCFHQLGMAPPEALGLALLARLINYLHSLVGGLCYVRGVMGPRS